MTKTLQQDNLFHLLPTRVQRCMRAQLPVADKWNYLYNNNKVVANKRCCRTWQSYAFKYQKDECSFLYQLIYVHINVAWMNARTHAYIWTYMGIEKLVAGCNVCMCIKILVAKSLAFVKMSFAYAYMCAYMYVCTHEIILRNMLTIYPQVYIYPHVCLTLSLL